MRKSLFAWLLLLCSNLFFFGCLKSGTHDPLSSNNQPISIEEAKVLFSTLHQQAEGVPSSGIPENVRLTGRSPLWAQAIHATSPDRGSMLMIPVQYHKSFSFSSPGQSGAGISLSASSFLTFYRDTNHTLLVRLVTTLPVQAKGEKAGKVVSVVVEEDWDGGNSLRYAYTKSGKSLMKPAYRTTKGATETARMAECVVIDWYECDYIDPWGNGTNCDYLYSDVYCDPTDNGGGEGGEGGGGGGGGSSPDPEDPDDPAIGKLCTQVATKVVGDSYTGTIRYLQWTWQLEEHPYTSWTTNYTDICVSVPKYGITAAEASDIFNKAFNEAAQSTLNELNAGLVSPTAQAISARFKELIQRKIRDAKPGAVWNTQVCDGNNIPVTEAQYCR